MKSIVLVILLSLLGNIGFAQSYTRVTSTNSYYSYSQVEYNYGPYYFNQTMGLVQGLLNDKKIKELKAEHKLTMQNKTKEYRDYYAGLSDFPVTIGDGWHDVIILNGDRMMDERKVLVKNNKISVVIWNNWLPEEVSFTGKIEKGKSVLSFKNASENLSGLIDVYFFNTIAEPSARAETPLQPSKLVFYTTKGSYKTMKISINNSLYGPFAVKHKKKDVIDVNDVQELIVYVKPGVIEYGKGSNYSGKITGKVSRVQAKSGESHVLLVK